MRLIKSALIGSFLGILIPMIFILFDGQSIPRHWSTDPELISYLNEYNSLAKERGLKFKNNINMGFRYIDRAGIVGMCRTGIGFKEIDLDTAYWKGYSKLRRTMLVFHELSHCKCNREHDWGKDHKYNEAGTPINIKNGFFSDGCPFSLMSPYLVEDNCAKAHYNDYLVEMFNRCIEY